MNEPCETPKMDPTKTVIDNLTWILEHASICEIGASNVNVASYMKHWEGRTEKAESQVTALKQELAQAKEEAKAAYDKGLGVSFCEISAQLSETKEKLAQMTTAFLTTEDALHNSKKALAALEGKLGEMRQALEILENQTRCQCQTHPDFNNGSHWMECAAGLSEIARAALSKCEKTPSAIADGNSPTPGAALEPIKKEEGGK